MRILPRTSTRKRLDSLEEEFRATSGLANPAAWLTDALSTRPIAGQRVTVDTALGLSGVWSAVTLISETLGMLPFKVYRSDTNGDPLEASQHRSWRMLHDRPNEITPANRFWATAAVHLLLWGNTFLATERDPFSGLVEQLWLEEPSGMQVSVDRNLRNKVFEKHTPQGIKRWNSESMIHVMGPSSDGFLGMSPITVCKQSFGIALAREKFEGNFYGRGATMRGLVQHPNLIGPDAAKNLRESLAAIYGGAENVGQIGVLEEGASFQSVSMPLSDLEFVASKQLTATEIATMFRIPPAYLGGSTGDSLTYATVESNKTHFATFAVAPWANAIASAISQDLSIFPQQNTFYAEFVQEGLLRADTQARANYYSLALDPAKGWMTRQEVRKRENLSERDDKVPEPPAPTNGAVPPELAANAQKLADATA
jgi:HK97 family phage portal protein